MAFRGSYGLIGHSRVCAWHQKLLCGDPSSTQTIKNSKTARQHLPSNDYHSSDVGPPVLMLCVCGSPVSHQTRWTHPPATLFHTWLNPPNPHRHPLWSAQSITHQETTGGTLRFIPTTPNLLSLGHIWGILNMEYCDLHMTLQMLQPNPIKVQFAAEKNWEYVKCQLNVWVFKKKQNRH